MKKWLRIKNAQLAALSDSCFLHLPVVVLLVVLLSALFYFPSFAASEIYQWKDKNGNVIFSDSPPSGSHAEEVRPKNNMRFDVPPSTEDDELETETSHKTATEKRLRDLRDIRVVMYMTDW